MRKEYPADNGLTPLQEITGKYYQINRRRINGVEKYLGRRIQVDAPEAKGVGWCLDSLLENWKVYYGIIPRKDVK